MTGTSVLALRSLYFRWEGFYAHKLTVEWGSSQRTRRGEWTVQETVEDVGYVEGGSSILCNLLPTVHALM